jgi:hypothetical protein
MPALPSHPPAVIIMRSRYWAELSLRRASRWSWFWALKG